MIRISNAAKAHFLKLLAKKEKGTQIRIFVINPGTPNAECGISYCAPDSVKMNDAAIRFGELIAYIDECSAPYLKDLEVDLIVDRLESKLTLKAPNVKLLRKFNDNKNSTLFERVEFFLETKINTQLAVHNGRVSLKEITNDGYVVLQFSGGCNGCSMVNFTLKNGIEKQLLDQFSEIKGVFDFTEHHRSKYSYY